MVQILSNAMVVIILQYINVSNQYIEHLKVGDFKIIMYYILEIC